MYAVVRTGGKQYRVEEGRAVKVDRLPGDPGDTIELGDVLLMGEGESITIGAPTVSGARVLGTIAEQGRARKIIVFRYKSKTRSRKKTGHRQHFTRGIVDDILAAGQEPKPKAQAAAPATETPAEAPKKRGRKTAETEAETAPTEAEVSTAEVEAPEAVDETAAPEKPKRSRRKTE